MLVDCHDCSSYMHGCDAHPSHPGYVACKKGCMVPDIAAMLKPGAVIREGGISWYSFDAAPLEPHHCRAFKCQGKTNVTETSDWEYADWTEVPDINDDNGIMVPTDPADLDELPSEITIEMDELADCIPESTGTPVWSEPISTVPENLRRLRQRKQRATVKSGDSTWVCPHCGRPAPAYTLDGKQRKGCPNPRCAGLARAARAHARGLHRNYRLPQSTVDGILNSYVPREYGYRRVARDFKVDPSTVRDIVQRRTRKEG